jgi:hypothetical protein
MNITDLKEHLNKTNSLVYNENGNTDREKLKK